MPAASALDSLPLLRIARGALRVEEALLADIATRLEGGVADLARPLRVIVPSRSLRRHLLGRIVAERGATVGITVQTLRGAALEVLRRTHATRPSADALLEVLARRHSRRQPRLAAGLEGLRDGFAAAAASVRDLLDAGFVPAHLEALDELLEEEGGAVAPPVVVLRARELLRAAAATHEAVEELELGPSYSVLPSAAERIEEDPDRALPTRGLIVHGFNDATGVASDLLVALLRSYGGTAYLDRPPDPADRARDDAGAAFTRKFQERLSAVCRLEEIEGPGATPSIELFRALGEAAEARRVAERLRSLLGSGVAPEGVAVVTRDPARYAGPLRRELSRLGVPFSGTGVDGPPGATARRLEGLGALLTAGDRLPADRWLELRRPSAGDPSPAELRTALATLGVRSVGDLARLEPQLRRRLRPLRLDVVDRLEPDERGDGRRWLPQRRTVAAPALASVAGDAAACLEPLAERGRVALEQQIARLRSLVEALGWEPADSARTALEEALLLPLSALDPRLTLALEEVALIASRRLADAAPTAFGGEGSGVQVMGVTDARGRTFDLLMLVGVQRGTFPRSVQEDPLLPDTLRHALARTGHGVLPDLALKRDGFEEERFLFAELLSASRQVEISWLEVDDENRPATPSPLVERLRWGAASEAFEGSGPTVARPALTADADPVARGARLDRHEALIRAALTGARGALAPHLARQLEAAGAATPLPGALDGLEATLTVPPAPLAAARVAVLAELDPPPGGPLAAARRRLGPFLGLVGAGAAGGDRLPVTRYEGLARCPWQTFLERVLGLRPAPDPQADVPALEQLWLGVVVHDVLERVAGGAVKGRDLLSPHPPTPRPWPAPEVVDRWCREAAEEAAQRAGFGLPGLAPLLAAAARPYLEVARKADWTTPPSVVGVELWGELQVGDGPAGRPLTFKADRVDSTAAGTSLTDYKTGRPVTGKDSEARRAGLLGWVESGRALQAAAYAAAVAKGDGRYLYLHPTIEDPDARHVVVDAGDSEMLSAFATTVETLGELWDRGLFFPRLVLPDDDAEPRICSFCNVAEACLRGDSGARGRLRAWAAEPAEDADARAAVAGFRLAATEDRR